VKVGGQARKARTANKKLKRVIKALAELVIEIGTLYAMIRFMIDR